MWCGACDFAKTVQKKWADEFWLELKKMEVKKIWTDEAREALADIHLEVYEYHPPHSPDPNTIEKTLSRMLSKLEARLARLDHLVTVKNSNNFFLNVGRRGRRGRRGIFFICKF